MPVRYEFEKELNKLHKDIIKMGAMIEQSIDDVMVALNTMDVDLAKAIIVKDDAIDKMEQKVEQDCINIIARQQPIASDLRDVISISKISTDLERIADHCEDISEYIIELNKTGDVKSLDHLPVMAEKVKAMINDAIDAYIKKDIALAKEVIERDDEVDDLFDALVTELTDRVVMDGKKAKNCSHYLFIVKYFERMADHATNVCEWIAYYVTGELQ